MIALDTLFSTDAPPTFNHANGTWLFSNYLFYNPVKGLCYADEVRLLSSKGVRWMHDNELRDFSHVGKPHDTLEDLARRHAALKKYSQWFTEPGLRCSRFGGHRLTVVSRRLQSLLVDNGTIDGVLGRHWGNST